MSSQINIFYYLDYEGLGSLFVQSGKPYIEAVIHKKIKDMNKNVSSKIGIGSLFTWLGIGEAKVEGELSHERLDSEEFTEYFRKGVKP